MSTDFVCMNLYKRCNVLTSSTLAGENTQASTQLLPAATVIVIPELMRLRTASSTDWDALLPRDNEATAGWMTLDATQSKPK